MVFCANCGTNCGDAKFCSNCGAPTVINNNTSSSSAVPRQHQAGPPSKVVSPRQQAVSPRQTPAVDEKGLRQTGYLPTAPGPVLEPVRPAVSAYKVYNNQKQFMKPALSVPSSTFGGSNVRHDLARQQGAVVCGLPSTTYGKQPAWAYAEQHKNQSGQYADGQFRHIHK